MPDPAFQNILSLKIHRPTNFILFRRNAKLWNDQSCNLRASKSASPFEILTIGRTSIDDEAESLGSGLSVGEEPDGHGLVGGDNEWDAIVAAESSQEWIGGRVSIVELNEVVGARALAGTLKLSQTNEVEFFRRDRFRNSPGLEPPMPRFQNKRFLNIYLSI